MNKKETGFFREQWIYFKRGKNEINFLMNVYQTIILLLGVSFIAERSLYWFFWFTLAFALSFAIVANRIGKYTTKKVDTSAYFISPYFIDQNLFRGNLLLGLIELAEGENDNAQRYFSAAYRQIEKWLV